MYSRLLTTKYTRHYTSTHILQNTKIDINSQRDQNLWQYVLSCIYTHFPFVHLRTKGIVAVNINYVSFITQENGFLHRTIVCRLSKYLWILDEFIYFI